MGSGFFKGRNLMIIMHLSVWLMLFLLPTYFFYLNSSEGSSFLYRSLIQIAIYAIVFYFNYLLLTPFLFLKGRRLLYFATAFALVALATIANEASFRRYDHHKYPEDKKEEFIKRFQPVPGMPFRPDNPGQFNPVKPPQKWPIYNFLITTLFISGFGMGLCYSDKFRKQEKERKESEKEKLNAELAFLKNQINPHFFFNTLNNIYSLVQIDVADGQKAILQLSKLMRYLLYETERDDKPLSEELEFMKTYIELMRLRISDKVALDVEFPENIKYVTIPPLLFLPFIENAFKHGISYRKPSFIKIILKLESDGIWFECSNSIGGKWEMESDSRTGIGLENIKKRLALLFPGRHQLNYTKDEEVFTATLKIELPTKAVS
jgi:hypothetical protein